MEKNKRFLSWFRRYTHDALTNNERRLVILSGQESWALSLLSSIELVSNAVGSDLKSNDSGQENRCVVFGDSKVISSNVSPKRFRDYLGSESDIVIFADSQFSIDAFAALTGTLKAGGICFLILPSLEDTLKKSLFIRRFYALVKENKTHKVIHQFGVSYVLETEAYEGEHLGDEKQNSIESSSSSVKSITNKPLSPYPQGCITQEQYNAVKAINKVVSGHRKRPLVLTADRGRGKSSALAIACAQLMVSHEHSDFSLVITAPDIHCLSIFYQQLHLSLASTVTDYETNTNTITYGKSTLSFVPIDQLIKQPFKCNLLMVDEAAAIPVYLLEQMLSQYHRMIFSSTVHGYEGAGRGFTLKFQTILNHLCPQWRKFHINQPIRWRENDPLEQLVFETCLLNTELPELTLVEKRNDNDLQLRVLPASFKFKTFNAADLVNDEKILKQIFSVLVTAHYQTKPSDLMMLLDKKQIQIACLCSTMGSQQEVIAVSLLMKEGAAVEVNSEDILDVKHSKRRLRDHFLPQSLLTHCGVDSAFNYSYLRILRIAVHPVLHQRGIGTLFIKEIIQLATQQAFDFIGASFGANQELLSYWFKAGFKCARIGFSKDKASGEHSALVLKGLNSKAIRLEENISGEFYRHLDYLLLDEYKELAPELVRMVFKNNTDKNRLGTSRVDINNVKAYANGERLYSSCAYSLYLWFKELLVKSDSGQELKEIGLSTKSGNDVDMQLVLIARLIQKHDAQSVCQQFGFTGKKMLNQAIKDYVNVRLKGNQL